MIFLLFSTYINLIFASHFYLTKYKKKKIKKKRFSTYYNLRFLFCKKNIPASFSWYRFHFFHIVSKKVKNNFKTPYLSSIFHRTWLSLLYLYGTHHILFDKNHLWIVLWLFCFNDNLLLKIEFSARFFLFSPAINKNSELYLKTEFLQMFHTS